MGFVYHDCRLHEARKNTLEVTQYMTLSGRKSKARSCYMTNVEGLLTAGAESSYFSSCPTTFPLLMPSHQWPLVQKSINCFCNTKTVCVLTQISPPVLKCCRQDIEGKSALLALPLSSFCQWNHNSPRKKKITLNTEEKYFAEMVMHKRPNSSKY